MPSEITKKKTQPIDLNDLYKNAISGALRGCLMGLITSGVEGAITGGITMALINPMITGIEHAI